MHVTENKQCFNNNNDSNNPIILSKYKQAFQQITGQQTRKWQHNTFEVIKPTHALIVMLNDAEQWYQMKTKTCDWHLA